MFIPTLDGEWSFAHLPFHQQGLARSLNRSAELLVACALRFEAAEREAIAREGKDVGIYCAVEPTNAPVPQVMQLVSQAQGSVAKSYAQLMPPKWGLQCGASLVAAAVSIVLGVEGGVHTFCSAENACLHSLVQAQMDLRLGHIRAALVCAVNSKEDPFVVERHRREGLEFAEGAAIVKLTEDNYSLDLTGGRRSGRLYFGAADSLMQTLWSQNRSRT